MEGKLEYEPLKDMGSYHERSSTFEQNAPPIRRARARRRSSIAAGPSLEVTPEYYAIERSTSYNQFAEFTANVKTRTRRNSLTRVENQMKLRQTLFSTMDFQSQSHGLQKLRERFERRGSVMGQSRSSTSAARSPDVIRSVVDTGTTDGDHSMDFASFGGKESASMPLTEVHQTIQRKRKSDLEREHLIDSLVNFSCHTPSAVLEDLVAHELKLWDETEKNLAEDETSAHKFSDDGSLSSLSSEDNGDDKGRDSEDSLVQSSLAQLHLTRPSLPRSEERESALLFVDINGFTKLSTMLDVESLSKVINSYFEMIVSEVILHGGDILKFAGDAFFAEWRLSDDRAIEKSPQDSSALKQLNASLSSSQELSYSSLCLQDSSIVSSCVWQAAKCAASIVKKFSDYHVALPGDSSFNSNSSNGAMLNVHCGIGVGDMIGLHVGDYREGDGDEGQEENAVELRREYLFLGDAINQVSRAAHIASDGEVLASPEALRALSVCCDVPNVMVRSIEPQCIASRSHTFISLEPKQDSLTTCLIPKEVDVQIPVYENLRKHCKHFHRTALSRLHLQMALYVHPVMRGDALAISKGATTMPTLDAPESRHLAEAELRSVYIMFIKALVSPHTTGRQKSDTALFKTLGNIMHVTSRELDRYSGHLRQFIVDDKGVVLIATFGLRGSTFPNLVANNALPATFDIHKALREELGVENRIGATFGQVYCGVVGGIRRHEFSVMGAAVNLAARLMESPMNTGLLVDEAVKSQAGSRFEFRSLQPVKAKGYDKPVAILEPLHAISLNRKRGTTMVKMTGRQEERNEILGFVLEILDDPTSTQSSVINLIGESGIGKSALGLSVMNEVKLDCLKRKKKVINVRSTSTESEQRVPLCAFRKVFLGAIRELCAHDESISLGGECPPASRRHLSEGIDKEADDEIDVSEPRRSLSNELHQSHLNKDPRLPWQDQRTKPKVKQLAQPEQRRSLRGMGASFRRGSSKRTTSLNQLGDVQLSKRCSATSLARPLAVAPNAKWGQPTLDRRDSFGSTAGENQPVVVPYLGKLRWACEEVGYPCEYADLVGSQFLGLNSAHSVTHINGHVPLVAELVEFVAQAFMRITDFADLILVFIDDFQWVDSFTWKVIRALGQSGKKMLLICAMRSHDKQALRRISTAVNFRLEITLSPLDLSDIKALICSVLGYADDAIDEFLCTEIYQKTGGLPVYVIELLEALKRNNTLSQDGDGKLRLSIDDQLVDKGKWGNSAMMESLLNRFDALAVRVRKILQTCAVLGNSFALSDLIRVHPETNEKEMEDSLEVATNEMILVEIVEEEEDNKSVFSNSTGGSDSKFGSSIEYSKTSSGLNVFGDRYFEFSHDMWRSNVLTTMLKERKIELHRLIAEAMEKEQHIILQRCDIARLLTLFDHWKSCGDFCKAAPLALAVGTRLDEWDLAAQSLDLYQDAVDMCFECVEPVEERNWRSDDDWVQVSSKPEVLENVLALKIRIAESQRLMGDLNLSEGTLQDAYTILNSSSWSSSPLMIPLLAELCSVKSELDSYDDEKLQEQETLVRHFVKVAQEEGNAVHLARALAMEASFFAQQGNLERALQDQQVLQMVYKVEKHSARLIELYEKDFAAECISQSILWYFLEGNEEKASRQADLVVQRHLPFQDPQDIDSIVALILPAILVLKFVGRAAEAGYLIKKYAINAYHDLAPGATYWVEMFNPICYLLEVVKMEDEDKFDLQLLSEIQAWVLDEVNSYYSPEHLRLGHTLVGETCWRLGNLKQIDDPMRQPLLQKARWFLTPIARDPHSEPFLAHSALAFLKAM